MRIPFDTLNEFKTAKLIFEDGIDALNEEYWDTIKNFRNNGEPVYHLRELVRTELETEYLNGPGYGKLYIRVIYNTELSNRIKELHQSIFEY